MSLNAATQARFKQMALRLFNLSIVLGDNSYSTPAERDYTGAVVTEPVIYPVRMFRSEVKTARFSDTSPVRTGDQKFVMLQDELPVMPTIEGTITYQGSVIQLSYIEIDPADVTWVCYGQAK